MRSTLGALVFALCALALPEAAAAAAPITFQMYIGEECVSGVAKPDAQLTLDWRAATGTRKANASFVTDIYGHWTLCLQPGGRVEIGDRFEATVGAQRRRFTVPALTVELDRVNDLIVGTGPAGTNVDVGYLYSGSDTGESSLVPVAGDGTWQFDPEAEVTTMLAWLNWASDGDAVSIEATSPPELIVTLNSARFSGYTTHFNQIHVVVLDAHGGQRGSGVATSDKHGRFNGIVRDAAGRAVKVRAGDRVVAADLAPDADFTMPTITATANIRQDVVSGRCTPTGAFAFTARASIYRADGRPRGTPHGVPTDGAGNFTIHTNTGDNFFSYPANIKRGDQVKVDCVQATSDAARLSFIAR